MKTEEDEAFEAIERKQGGFQAKRAMAADKLQEPVARVTGVYGGRFTYDPINRAMVLPIGMALYAGPPQRTWVGMTAEETSGFTSHEMTVVKYVSKVLQEKNHG